MIGPDPQTAADSRRVRDPSRGVPHGVRTALRQRWDLLGWSLTLLLACVAALVLLVLWATALLLVPFGVGLPLTKPSTLLVRGFADRHRTWASRQLGAPVRRPYLPVPVGRWRTQLRAIGRDPATWRDGAWLAVDSAIGWLTAGGPFLIFAAGVFYLVYPLVFALTPAQVFRTPLGPHVPLHSVAGAAAMVPLGLLLLTLWYISALPLATGNAKLIRALLGPPETARLRARVAQLAASRAENVDTQAGELRRIERDLHDGAQARLAALGMSLGLAEQLLAEDDRQAVARLLSEARESTSMALAELRDLVRGIHPPVLADRGLDGAVRALALAIPVPTEVRIDLPGRLPDAVESAAYFAVAEALANAVKHAYADHIAVHVDYTGHGDRVDDTGQADYPGQAGVLNIRVSDDGRGGASFDGGTGLRGIERRLRAFDGTMTVDSPVGGPTELRMSLPCVLS